MFNLGDQIFCFERNMKRKKPYKVVSGSVVVRHTREEMIDGELDIERSYQIAGRDDLFPEMYCFESKNKADAACSMFNAEMIAAKNL